MKLEEADAFNLDIWIGKLNHKQVEELMVQWMEQVHAMGGASAMAMTVSNDSGKINARL